MLGLSFSFVGPQFVISAGVAGAHEFCGVGAGTRSGQTTALLVLALCALLYAAGVLLFSIASFLSGITTNVSLRATRLCTLQLKVGLTCAKGACSMFYAT